MKRLALWVVLFSINPCLALAEGGGTLLPVLRHQAEGIDLRVLRTPAGYLVDASIAENAAEGLGIKLFSGETDVTAAAETGRPAAAIVYFFAGADEARQCRAKWRMDAVLALGPLPNPAFSESPNALCPELGFAGANGAWVKTILPQDSYRRVLAILVSEAGDGAFFKTSNSLLWDQLAIPYALLDDRDALANRLTAFVQPNITGLLSILPTPQGDANAPLRVVVYKDGAQLFAVSSAQSAAQTADSPRARELIIAAAAILVVLAGAALLWTRRRGRAAPPGNGGDPVKAVSIGYGGGFDYSLGEGAEQAVARLEVYRDGRRKIVRLDTTEEIQVNGVEIEASTWIDGDAAITIAQKRIKLS